MKKLIGLAAITGVVIFAYVRSLGAKVNANSALPVGAKQNDQLV